jgi:hypothetical protein
VASVDQHLNDPDEALFVPFAIDPSKGVIIPCSLRTISFWVLNARAMHQLTKAAHQGV